MSGRVLTVLLADDEPLIREGLREPLLEGAGVRIVAECGSGTEAVRRIRSLRPDIAFLDVKMPGLDGFQVLEQLSPEERPWVVFVTAYDEYALDAFQAHAVDYLLKPFGPDRVRVALGRARAMLAGHALGDVRTRLADLLDAYTMRDDVPRRLAVRLGLRTVFVDVDDIDYLEADGNYVQIHVGGEQYPARDTLTALEARLGFPEFVRVHRSFLVRVERIRELRAVGVERWEVLLGGGRRLPVSGAGRARLMTLLGEV